MNRLYTEKDWSLYFIYDETSPSGLRWAVDRRCIKAFDPAGSKVYSDKSKMKPKCWDVRVDGKLFKAHIIVWVLNGYTYNHEFVINHKDCNPFNNKISNLENISQSDNMRRCKAHKGDLQVNNTTGFTGVSTITRKGELFGFQATASLASGSNQAFFFSKERYGEELARLLAKTARDYQLATLESGGICYG